MQTIYADQLHDSVDHALAENTTMEHAGMHIEGQTNQYRTRGLFSVHMQGLNVLGSHGAFITSIIVHSKNLQ